MLSWMPTAGSGQERSFPQISQPAILTYTALSKMAVYRWRLVTNPGVGNLGFDIVERHRDKSCLRLRLWTKRYWLYAGVCFQSNVGHFFREPRKTSPVLA